MAYPSFHKEIDVCFVFCFTVLTETSLGIALFFLSITGFGTKQGFTQINMNTQQSGPSCSKAD